MRKYIYFILNILAILCIDIILICVVGSFIELQSNSGKNFVEGLIFFGIVSFLVMSFSIMWCVDSWYNLQRAINRSK